ncbi:MAG: glucoamylase family protein [Paracoccaceae bacterium]
MIDTPPRPDPAAPDEALMEATARAACAYFTRFAHPETGMARERSTGAFGYDTAHTVATGGTGFGLMAILSAMHRGWIARGDGERLIARIADFLAQADRFDGVWPHFIDARTARTIPFSKKDDGGDLVETGLLAMGLVAAREALAPSPLAERLDALLAGIDWAAHHRPADAPGGEGLMWHRSPRHEWDGTSLPITGWNEALGTWVLAAGSATHPIEPGLYHRGWARGGAIVNGQVFHGVRLPVGPDKGGPMFLSQYPFLGLDPAGLVDPYADYAEQTRAHTAINRAHCLENPHGHAGYGADLWGLTASDDPDGYAAHEPYHDNGTISPTAAVASIPYAPEWGLAALRGFVAREELWGPFGLGDAFNDGRGWVAPATLAIDQGPIAVMIENHRSGLLWSLCMGAREVRAGLKALGFRSPRLTA